MTKISYIYVITTFSCVKQKNRWDYNYGAIRTVGWYRHYSDALEAVFSNSCDMWEYCYDYVALESLPEGMYPTTNSDYYVEYFKFNPVERRYERIDAEEVTTKGILQTWSIG